MTSRIKFILILSLFLMTTPYADATGRRKQADVLVGLRCKGVMESFPKVGQGIETRLQAYSQKGYTHYFYSPSDDRYCNSWGWKILYNDSERHQVRSIANTCKKMGLKFVWTVNPDKYWTDGDYPALLNKLVMMYYNDIRAFAVDFSAPVDSLSKIQNRLKTDIEEKVRGDVEIYMLDALPVVVYPSHLDPIRTLVGGYFFSDDFLSSTIASDAVICDLALKDYYADFALTAVSDLAKDPEKYSANESLAKGIDNMPSDAREMFKSFLYHMRTAGDSGRKSEYDSKSWSDEIELRLYNEFKTIEEIGSAMQDCGDDVLKDALKPYLLQFKKFGRYGVSVLECLDHYQNGEYSDFWTKYISNLRTEDDVEELRKYPVGDASLHDFCNKTMDYLVSSFSTKTGLSLKYGDTPALDADMTTSQPSSGHWECVIPPKANTCNLLLGRLPQGERVYFRQLGTDGRLIAEFIITSTYNSFDLKPGSVKVDVIGDVDIYETIFVSL